MGMKPRASSNILAIEYVDIDELAELEGNPKKHKVDSVVASMRRFGFRDPIEVDGRTITSGHGRSKALQFMRDAGETPPHGVVVDDGRWLVPVVKGAKKFKSARERDAYVVAANQTVIAGGWDDELLKEKLSQFDASDIDALGFDRSQFDRITGQLESTELAEPVVKPPKKAVSKAGTLWQLGEHRLLCGDCRNGEDMKRLFAGERFDVAVTSPPYASQREYDDQVFKPIAPDDYVAWWEKVQHNIAAYLSDGGSFFVNIKENCVEGQRHLYVKDLCVAMVRQWGWRFVDEFCWYHSGTPKAVKQRFKNGWEPIFQFTRQRPHRFFPDNVRTLGDPARYGGTGEHPSQEDGNKLLTYTGNVARAQGGGREVNKAMNASINHGRVYAYPSNAHPFAKNDVSLGHGAAFGVPLPAFFIKAFSEAGDRVFDPFMGSGTTLIAAEREKRISFGMEVSPGYCDVIVERWQGETGKKAKRVRVR